MRVSHPSNTVHEATDYLDALRRHEHAVQYEKGALAELDRHAGKATDTASYDEAMRQTATARAIWLDEFRALDAEIARITREAKGRAALRMQQAGIDGVYPDALVSADYGLLAI